MAKAKTKLEDAVATKPKYSVSDCISFPIRDFARNDLENTDDRIILWQSAEDLAKTILSTLKKHGFTVN